MRSPDRIEPTLAAIKQVWEKNPDLRLGQLMWKLARQDPFYIEDNELVERAKSLSYGRA
jgi:uncharacterized protein YihD (DUF1040 family)